MNETLFPVVRIQVDGGKLTWSGDTRAKIGAIGDVAEYGEGFLAWKTGPEHFIAEVDRYGAFPCFYLIKKNLCIVSSTLHQVVEQYTGSLTFNLPALSVFLRTGYFMGGKTLFKEVSKLGPGGKIHFDEGEFKVSEVPLKNDLASISESECFETAGELFRQAVQRRAQAIKGPVCHPLSGGRDSRHIFLELLRQKVPIEETFTLRLTASSDPLGDEAIAKQLSARTGLKHRSLVPDWDRQFAGEIVKNVTTGCLGSEGGWMTSCIPYLANKRSIFDGMGGDVLCAGLFLRDAWRNPLEKGDVEQAAEGILKTLQGTKDIERIQRLASKLCGCPADAFSEEVAKAEVVSILKPYLDYHNPSTMFFLQNRTFNIIAASSFGCYRSLENIFTPFLDKDFFNFMISQPEARFKSKAFHTKLISLMYPEYSKVPYTGSENVSSILGGTYDKLRDLSKILTYTARMAPHVFADIVAWSTTGRKVTPRGSGMKRQMVLLLLEGAILHRKGGKNPQHKILTQYYEGAGSQI